MEKIPKEKIYNSLSIAGIDPSAGAGIFSDIKVMSALGVYGCGVVTALTVQNTKTVQIVSPVPSNLLAQQLDCLLSDISINSVKIGMVPQTDSIIVLTEKLTKWNLKKIVLDPVMISKSGHPLIENSTILSICEFLLPLATIITPNLPETGALLQINPPENMKEMRTAAEKIRSKMSNSDNRWVLIKGGHLPGSDSIDILHDGDRMIEIPGKKIETLNTHGTGCSLSSAIAALLTKYDVQQAVYYAKSYLIKAIQNSNLLNVGSGKGPVHHFHNLWG